MRNNNPGVRVHTLRERLAAVLAALGVVTMTAGFVVMSTAGAASGEPVTSVTVCHATSSEVRPYSGQNAQITIGGDGAVVLSGGHASHIGPLYEEGMKDDGIVWGDIIPSFEYVDKDGVTQTYPGLNWPEGQSILEAGCRVPGQPDDEEVTPVEPTFTDPTCENPTAGLVVPADTEAIDYSSTGTAAPGSTVTVTAVPKEGYEFPPGTTDEWSHTYPTLESLDCSEIATPVAPTVVQSSQCNAEGTYTIPTTAGVQYLLNGDEIAAGTYDGPASGTITAAALDGFELADDAWSFALDVEPAAICPAEASAVTPTVQASEKCEVEGTYTIPATAGVQYLLDGEPIDAGTFEGPASGLITAEGVGDTALLNEDFAFTLDLAAAAKCPVVKPEVVVERPVPTVQKPATVVSPTAADVPTAVSAGIGDMPLAGGTPTGLLIGQGLVGAGSMLLLMAGWVFLRRQSNGVSPA